MRKVVCLLSVTTKKIFLKSKNRQSYSLNEQRARKARKGRRRIYVWNEVTPTQIHNGETSRKKREEKKENLLFHEGGNHFPLHPSPAIFTLVRVCRCRRSLHPCIHSKHLFSSTMTQFAKNNKINFHSRALQRRKIGKI